MEHSTTIINLAQTVFDSLGVGFSERIYHNALEVIFRLNNIPYESERIVPVSFLNHVIGNIRADLIAFHTSDSPIVIELKAVNSINSSMIHQSLSYLKMTHIKKALLVNFSPQGLQVEHVHLI